MMKWIIFDLDGTILDTLEGMRHHLNRALETAGLPPVGSAVCRRLVGNGLRRLAEDSIEGTPNPELVKRVSDDLTAAYRADPCLLVRPYPGVPETLSALAKAGFSLAVVTNKDEPVARALTDEFYPEVFDAVVGTVPGRAMKPDPERIRLVLADGNRPRAVFVGDSRIDVGTARAAGIPVVGVTWGYGDGLDGEYRPDALASGPDELFEAVMRLAAERE